MPITTYPVDGKTPSKDSKLSNHGCRDLEKHARVITRLQNAIKTFGHNLISLWKQNK